MNHRSILIFFLVASIFVFALRTNAQTLSAALDATNLTWTTGGTSGGAGWSGETTTTHDGISAAQSYQANFNATSFLQTTVTGPGTLSFWCYSQDAGSTLSFSVGGVTQMSFNGTTSWVQPVIYVGSGSQILKWTFSSPSIAFHPAYLDQVHWVTGTTAPIITNEPPSQSQVEGLRNTFTVGVLGTQPFSYQWHFNDIDIPGATSASYTVSNVQATNLGNYSVTITNVAGATNSVKASLEFGEVTAWGVANYLQTSVPPGATNVLGLAAGFQHGVALKGDGSLLTWGGNDSGQTTIPQNLSNIVAVAANGNNSMTIKSDGTLVEWGDNSYGQTNMAGSLTNLVSIAPAPASLTTLALRSDGTAIAAGPNAYGQTNVPPNLSNIVAVAAAYGHSMALKSDGTVVMWGSDPSFPANVPADLTNVVAIATGNYQALALKSDGTIAAWGQNLYGLTNVPTGLLNVVAIGAGASHNLALKADGTVVAWGNNSSGQTNVPTGLTNVVAIAAGQGHNLALVGNGPPIMSAPIQNPTLSPTGFSFSLPSQSGRVYALEYKDSLADTTWTALPLVAGNGTNVIMTDPAPGNSQRFYRVRRW